jgi:perosamine synthetase
MLNELIISDQSSISEVIEKININKKGIIFLCDSKNKIYGSIADGDVRRSIIKGVDLESKAKKIANKKFLKMYATDSREVGIDLLNKNKHKNINIIPVIKKNGQIIDCVSEDRLYNIPVYSTNLSGNELKYLTNCIKSNWISSNGPYVRNFEKSFAKKLKVNDAVSVSSGTTALHLALLCLGIKKGDEVIVPDITFAATINAILYVGAKPVIANINAKTWTIETSGLKKILNQSTKAIIAVHLFGNPCNLKFLVEFCKKNKLFLIEDCAEAIGSCYQNKLVGKFGDAATFSFYGNKTITTGEGGMLFFKNSTHNETAKLLRDHGMNKKKRYYHDMIGYNYRLTNMQAAIGCAQIERFDKIINEKIQIAKEYKKYLKLNKNISFQKDQFLSKNTFWAVAVQINSKLPILKIIQKLESAGIEVRNFFYPMSAQKIYKKYQVLRNQNELNIFNKGLILPSFNGISKKEIKYISRCLTKIINGI